MNDKFLLYVLYFAISIFSTIRFINSACWNAGMKETPLYAPNIFNQYGTARAYPPSICASDGTGGLWFNRPVFIHPRFEVNLIVDIGPAGCNDGGSWATDGWTLILSKQSNYLNGWGGYLGYAGITSAIVTEFDFWYNSEFGDIAWNTVSTHKCLNSACDAYENGNTIQRQVSPDFDRCKYMSYDIRLFYSNGLFSIYVNGYAYISISLSLEEAFGSWAFLGFTGFIRGNVREYDIRRSSICEDNYDPNLFLYKWIQGSTLVENGPITIAAGSPVTYSFAFRDSSGYVMPHLYGYQIWAYTMNFSINCGDGVTYSSNTFTVLDRYYLQLTINGCKVAGNYNLINTANLGTLRYPLYFKGASYSNLMLLGYNGGNYKESQITRIDASNNMYFNFGSSGGTFTVDDFGGSLSLDFASLDQYGNQTPLDNNPQASMAISIYNNGAIISYTTSVVASGKYRITFNITNIGTYKIASSYFSKNYNRYFMTIIPGKPSASYTSCTLMNYTSSPTLDGNTVVAYTCVFRDSMNNILTPAWLNQTYGILPTCTLTRAKFFVFSETLQTTVSTSENFTCSGLPVKQGSYSFAVNVGSLFTAPSIIGKFTVLPGPLLSSAIVYDYSINKFTSLTNSETNITYVIGTTTLTLLDFYDTDGDLFSLIGYNSGFSPSSSLQGTIIDTHNPSYSSSVRFAYSSMNNKNYIGVFLDNAATYMLRNSFQYQLTLSLNSITITIFIKYPMSATYNNLKVCTHSLSAKNTQWIPSTLTPVPFVANSVGILGSFFLQTQDNNLYNYKLSDISALTATATPNLPGTYIGMQEQGYDGQYAIIFQAVTATNYNVSVNFNNTFILQNYAVSYTAVPAANSLTLSPKNLFISTITNQNFYDISSTFTADAPVKIYINAFDIYNNLISTNPTIGNNYFGIKISLAIQGVNQNSNLGNSTINFFYDPIQNLNYVMDYFTTAGTHLLMIKSTLSTNSIIISYQVLPGQPIPSLSSGTLTSSKTLKVNQYATISILLLDSAGNNLANQPSLTNVIPNIMVSVLDSDNIVSALNFVDISQLLFRFTTNQLSKVSTYNFKISYNNTNSNTMTSIPCADCSFAVVYDTFDITKCKLSGVLNSNIILSTNTTLQINNQLQNPLFNFNFFDSNGQPLQYVNPNSNIIAVFSGANLQFNFISQFISTSQILYTFPTTVNIQDIVGGNYNISIFYNNVVSQIYPVQLTGDGQDSDAGNGGPNFNLTYFYSTVLNAVAANDVSFKIEFRTAQNLRVNNIQDFRLFSFTNSKNYTSPAFNVKTSNGAKKGQYIITVNSIIASYINNPINMAISYNNIIISQVVNVIVHSTSLNSIVVDPSSIVSTSTNQLNNGTTVNSYLIWLTAYDKYGNIFQDVFNSTLYSPSRIAALFNIQYQDNSQISVTANANSTTQSISLSVITTKTGTVNLNSFFLSQQWQWNVNPGPLSSNYTFGTITNPSASIVAGNNATFEIFPRDNYNNIISLAQLADSDYNLLCLNITQPANQNNLSPLNKQLNQVDGSILFTVPLYQFGNNYFLPTLTTGQTLSCSSCQLQVNLAPINYKNSILNNGNITMTQSKPNNLTIGVYPTFSLYLNDNFSNTYNYIPSNFNYTVQFLGNQANVAICSAIQNNIINIFVCSTTANLKSWASLVSSSGYYLTIANNNSTLTYPINLSGSDNDSDASNAPLYVNNTYFSTDSITAVAGQVVQFMIELRGTDNKRNNFWYDNPSDNITVSFTNNNSVYTNSISYGPKYGQYYISVSSQKTFLPTNSNNSIYLTITGIICTTQVALYVTPATASSAFAVDSNNNNIPYGTLSSGNADIPYSQKLVFYDIYQNLAPVTIGNVNLFISPPQNKQNVQIQSNMVLNADNSITLTINSILSGTYGFRSNYFNTPYTFNVNSGSFSAENSLAVVPTSATAGNTINFFIIPFDANNNYIDPTNRTNEFMVTYNYKDPFTLNYVSNIPINAVQVGPYPNSDITSCSNCNAYVYTIQTNYRNKNNFAFTLNTTSVTCINCVTNVSPGSLAFTNSLLMRFDSSSGAFNQLTNNALEDNSKVDLKYRVYPRDIYSNSINSMSTPSNYTLVLTDISGVNYVLYNNIYNSTNQEYIEFIKNDNSGVNGDLTYNTLVGGNYTATFSNGIQNLTTSITLIGRPSDTDASNQKLNVQNTVITGMNLAFIAGQTGYLIIELKTIDNMRKNNWNQQVSISYLIVDNKNSTTPLTDNTFVSSVSPAGNLGLFYLSVSSSLARTSLNSNRFILQITVNSIIVANLQPQLIISPGQMASAAFVNTYLKSNNTLIDGIADIPYVFQTNGFDIYGNPTTCDGNILQLSILDTNQNRVNFNIDQAGSPGVAIFTLNNKMSGIYTITSGVGFLSQATFYNSFGSLNNLQSLTNNLSINLIAGSVASFSITPKDQYFNNITPNLVLSSISVTVTTPSGKNLSTTTNIVNEDIIFSTTMIEQGINSWQSKIHNKPTNCLNCITTVSPSVAVPANSLVSYLNDNRVYTVLSNNYQITRSNQNPLSVSVAFVDAYANLISIAPSTVSIQNSVIQGNYMTPMILNVALSSDNSALITSVNVSQQSAFGCLVSGSYSFSFTVLSGTQSYEFSMPLQLTAITNDSGYGNGNYVVEQTQLSNTSINMIAGTTFTINIKLRTAQMLYYHSDIDPVSDISYSLSSPDSSLTFTPYKRTTSFGDYNIDIFTTLATQSQTILKVLVRDPSNPNNFKEIPIPISFAVKPTTPPDNRQTNIVMQPDSTTLSGQSLIIQFQIYDKYGNLYVRNTNIINNNYLFIYQNSNQVTNAVITLLTDSITYQLKYIPAYPPRSCAISILYNDSQTQTNLLLTPISTQIFSYPFYPNTLVSGSNVNQMNAGDKLSVSVQLFDQNNICVDDTNINVVAQVTGPAEATIPSQKINYSYTFTAVVSQSSNSGCGTSYIINVPDTQVYTSIGTYNIIVLVGDNNYVAQVYTQKVVSNVLDQTKFISSYNMAGNFNPGAIVAGNSISFTLRGNDKYGNQVVSSIINSATIKLITQAGQLLVSNEDNNTNYDYIIQTTENQIGLLNIGITIFQANSYIVQYYYQGNVVNTVDTTQGPFNISIIPNVCSPVFPNVNISTLSSASSGTTTYFMVTCSDKYNNTITIGGESFTAFITLNILSSMTSSQVNSVVTDNLNGTYRVDFTPLLAGSYGILMNLGGSLYGNIQTVVISDTICTSNMPIRCPNNLEKCVATITDCLTSDNNACAMPTPFYCLVNNILTCVSSNTACDCPSGYVKCSIMNVCVPAVQNYMCSFTLPINCSTRFPKSPILCPDGICRSSINNSPSQRVCPLGSVLCADLSCRSSYSQCGVYNDCAGNMIRCSDQSCVLDQKNCPSSVTCSDPTMYVCPDSSCVSNELYCKPLPQCSNTNPILCPNNSCLANIAKCPKQVSCGQEKSLCQDLICKTNC